MKLLKVFVPKAIRPSGAIVVAASEDWLRDVVNRATAHTTVSLTEMVPVNGDGSDLTRGSTVNLKASLIQGWERVQP